MDLAFRHELDSPHPEELRSAIAPQGEGRLLPEHSPLPAIGKTDYPDLSIAVSDG
jgi:hypothetical protein